MGKKYSSKKHNKAGKFVRSVPSVKIYIKSSYNNTHIAITDINGNVLKSGAAGIGGTFKGTRKSSPYAAQNLVRSLLTETKTMYGIQEVHKVYLKGYGSGRDSAIKTIYTVVSKVGMIANITPVPFGGCRPEKDKRV